MKANQLLRVRRDRQKANHEMSQEQYTSIMRSWLLQPPVMGLPLKAGLKYVKCVRQVTSQMILACYWFLQNLLVSGLVTAVMQPSKFIEALKEICATDRIVFNIEDCKLNDFCNKF